MIFLVFIFSSVSANDMGALRPLHGLTLCRLSLRVICLLQPSAPAVGLVEDKTSASLQGRGGGEALPPWETAEGAGGRESRPELNMRGN